MWDDLAIAKRLERAVRGRLGALVRRPFESLPSRIILSVFSAALVASLAVAWISTQTIASFLRGEVDERFPAALERTGERLELWYSQRQLDIQTFARSTTLTASLGRFARESDEARARQEIRKYLAYVLERFPQYEALFLLDPEGGLLLWAGDEPPLSEALGRELARLESPRVSDFRSFGERHFQVVSAPVEDARGRRAATLHALLGAEALTAVLAADELAKEGDISLVAPNGHYLVDGVGSGSRGRYERPIPPFGARPIVDDYQIAGGEYVVGAAVRFPRFGWTVVVEEPYDAAFAPLVTVIRRIFALNLAIVGAFSVIAFLFARSIVRPILALSSTARRIAEGGTPTLIPEASGSGEIGVLIRVFNEMTTQLATQYDQLQRANEVLEQLSITDGLTRLHNHRFFQDALPREVRRSRRTGEPLTLILIDIDDFKTLNDRHGHAVGDAVLRRAAAIMNETVRDTDLLARYGGEEFALVAPGTDLAGGVALAEKVRAAVAGARFPVVDLDGPSQIAITVSAGVSLFRGDEKRFFNEADRALYRAKSQGKDCVVAAEEAEEEEG